jgi:hypothetical protein
MTETGIARVSLCWASGKNPKLSWVLGILSEQNIKGVLFVVGCSLVILDILFFFFFLVVLAGTLPFEPLHQSFFCDGFF